ncbi:MAG: peptidoglycan DD-metalloendopeptidase family protein [bacterium]|nr:peptidoglycan DD-metalloendopeptidase family protein [bacterium]
MIATLPNDASAFWPFSTNADAAVNILPQNSETTVLRAATNLDPNPNKGLGSEIQTSGGKALLAYAHLSQTVAYGADPMQPGRISVYVVRPGDTISEIADMFGVSVNTVIWANDLKNARDVRPGDTLIILPVSGIEHTISRGDTLASLAKKYGADAEEIALFNGLDSAVSLTVGSTVIIPDGEIAPPPAPAKREAPASTTKNPSRGGGSFLAGYFNNPLPGGIITQGLHDWGAVDIGAARGTPIYAAAQGTVIIARGGGARNGGYGNYVVITHNNDSQTLYSHMSSVAVSPGQSVSKGQTIGYVGSTGRSTGPHLHFEVRGAANPLRNCSLGSVCSPQ